MVGRVVANLRGDGPWVNLSPAACTSVWTSHLDSIDIALAEAGRDGEVRHIGSIGGDLAAGALDKALRKLISRGAPLHIVYEAGPCGFVVWRHLSAQGLHCEVVAPSSHHSLRRSAYRASGLVQPATCGHSKRLL